MVAYSCDDAYAYEEDIPLADRSRSFQYKSQSLLPARQNNCYPPARKGQRPHPLHPELSKSAIQHSMVRIHSSRFEWPSSRENGNRHGPGFRQSANPSEYV